VTKGVNVSAEREDSGKIADGRAPASGNASPSLESGVQPGVPAPDLPPPTMPRSARTGTEPPPPPERASVTRDGDSPAGGVPHGTAPEVQAAEGTAEAAAAAEGIHTPDVGPGGSDIDTDERPLTARPRTTRAGPAQPVGGDGSR
jgi:hypothetical protein